MSLTENFLLEIFGFSDCRFKGRACQVFHDALHGGFWKGRSVPADK